MKVLSWVDLAYRVFWINRWNYYGLGGLLEGWAGARLSRGEKKTLQKMNANGTQVWKTPEFSGNSAQGAPNENDPDLSGSEGEVGVGGP